MRARLVVLVVCVAAAASLGAPDALASSRHPQVAGLQVALRAQGLYRGAIDAIAGPATVSALEAFQRGHALRVTGRANARTRRALGPLGRPLFGRRILRQGESGWDVAVLQFLLLRHGIHVPVNAHLDAPTARGVRTFQRRHGLPVDGVVGKRTFAAFGRRGHAVRHVSSVSLRIHVVRSGDSLWLLAKRYRTTIVRLARLNHLDPRRALLIGTRLRVPARVRHRRHVPLSRTADRIGRVSSVQALLDRWARRYGVDVHLVRALAWMESGYNNALVSPTGARGIMQVEPYTWRFVEQVLIGQRVRHDASGNVRVGVAYLKHLLRDFHGNRRLALAGWYQGELAVRRHGIYKVSRPFVADVLALARRM